MQARYVVLLILISAMLGHWVKTETIQLQASLKIKECYSSHGEYETNKEECLYDFVYQLTEG